MLQKKLRSLKETSCSYADTLLAATIRAPPSVYFTLPLLCIQLWDRFVLYLLLSYMSLRLCKTMDKLHPGHVMQLAMSYFCLYQLICSLGLPARTGSKSRMLKLIVACTHTFSFPAQVSTRRATANGVLCLRFLHNLTSQPMKGTVFTVSS